MDIFPMIEVARLESGAFAGSAVLCSKRVWNKLINGEKLSDDDIKEAVLVKDIGCTNNTEKKDTPTIPPCQAMGHYD